MMSNFGVTGTCMYLPMLTFVKFDMQEAAANVTLVYTSRRIEVEADHPTMSSAAMTSYCQGRCSPQQYLLAAHAGREACQRLADFSYLSLHRSFS